VRVWYDGKLGAPIGVQTPGSSLLFHAATSNGERASFRPIVGCISLSQASKRSTVSAGRAGAAPVRPQPAAAAHPRASKLILTPGDARPGSTSCLKGEKLIGSWTAVGYGTSGPPRLPAPGAVKIVSREVGNTVRAEVTTASSIRYLIHVQIGAMCEPRP
jgi:hypothetical protein